MKQSYNRVENDLQRWRSREERFIKMFPFNVSNNRVFLKEKLNYYDTVVARHKGTPDQDERITLRLLNQERKEIEKLLYPTIVQRLLRMLLLGVKQRQVAKQNAIETAGNEKELKEIVRKAGFGQINSTLEENMKQGRNDFSIPVSYYINEKDRLDFRLSFVKGQDEQYHFDHYQATLRSGTKPEEVRQQTFQINRETTVTSTQAYNLLAGRSVQNDHKSLYGSRQRAWIQLDFNDKDASGNFKVREFKTTSGYDLKEILNQLPIKELQSPETGEKLLNALLDGNRQAVTFVIEGSEKKFFIEANPQFKSVNIYDEHSKKTSIAAALGMKTIESVQQAKQISLEPRVGHSKKNGLSIG